MVQASGTHPSCEEVSADYSYLFEIGPPPQPTTNSVFDFIGLGEKLCQLVLPLVMTSSACAGSIGNRPLSAGRGRQRRTQPNLIEQVVFRRLSTFPRRELPTSSTMKQAALALSGGQTNGSSSKEDRPRIPLAVFKGESSVYSRTRPSQLRPGVHRVFHLLAFLLYLRSLMIVQPHRLDDGSLCQRI